MKAVLLIISALAIQAVKVEGPKHFSGNAWELRAPAGVDKPDAVKKFKVPENHESEPAMADHYEKI